MAKKFVCGKDAAGNERFCTEEELEAVEKLRGGQLKAVDPASMLSGLDADVIAAKVGQVINAQNTGAGFLSYLKHEEDCPNCRELHRQHVTQHLNDYAAAPAAGPEPAVVAEKAADKPAEEKAGEPAAEQPEETGFGAMLNKLVPVKK